MHPDMCYTHNRLFVRAFLVVLMVYSVVGTGGLVEKTCQALKIMPIWNNFAGVLKKPKMPYR